MKIYKATVNCTPFAGEYEATSEAELAKAFSYATGEDYADFEEAILTLRRKGAIVFIDIVEVTDPAPAPDAPEAGPEATE